MSHKTYGFAHEARQGFCKSLDQKLRYSNNQHATNDALEAMGLLEPLNDVLKMIEQGNAHEAHHALDSLINPRYRSRSTYLKNGQSLTSKTPYSEVNGDPKPEIRAYSIAEAAKLAGLSVDNLRDWRRRGLLDGIGAKSEAGRTVYSPKDVTILTLARKISNSRLRTLKGIFDELAGMAEENHG